MGGVQKKLLWLLAAITLASMGIAIYFREIQVLKQEYEFASFFIKIASQQSATICREFAEIELERKNLEIARKLGDTGLVNAYNKQIEDKEQNIRDELSRYKDTIVKLGDLRKTVVDEEFDKYAQFLVQKKLFKKIRAAGLVKLHYQKFINDKSEVNVKIMNQACMEK